MSEEIPSTPQLILSPQDLTDAFIDGALICGESSQIMEQFKGESVDLIYGDPPFFTGQTFNRKWPEFDKNKDYFSMDDTCTCGMKGYLFNIVPVLKECYRVLKPTGSMYLHVDHNMVHYLKMEMDKIFGEDENKPENGFKKFLSQITWRRCHPKGNAKGLANNADFILLYCKNEHKTLFYPQYGEYSESTLKTIKFDDNDGNGPYSSVSVTAQGGKGYCYDLGYGEKQPPGGYRWKEETMLQKIEDGVVIIRKGLIPRQKLYASDQKGVPFDNVWLDIENVTSPISYSEKPPALMRRILELSSIPGNVVLDPFCGGGIFIREAQESYRTAIGIDKMIPAITLANSRTHANKVKVHGVSKEDLDKFVNENFKYDEEFKKLKDLTPYQFQTFACDKYGAVCGPDGGGDGGIDGWKITSKYRIGIQVKQQEDVTGVDYRKFEGDLRRMKYDLGVVIGFSFNGGAIRLNKDDMWDNQDINSENHIPIELKTIKELLTDEDATKIKDLMEKHKPKHPISDIFKVKLYN